jgi:hypothetical protein
MKIKSIALFFLPALICLTLNAQTSKFSAGVVAGLNFVELEGNRMTDYYGLNAGIIGTAKLSKHSQAGMEILFSQNGEYILPEYYPLIQYGQIRLDHVEVPVHIDWLIGVLEREKFYDWNLNIGLAYTRLLGYNVESIDKFNVTDQIVYGNKEAILLQAGTTYFFTQKTGINFKASLPIKIGLGWTLATRIIYMIK